MKKSNLFIAAAAAVMCLSSCGTKKEMSDSAISLGDKKWHLESFEGNNNEAFADTATFNVSFVNDSTINGIGACNRFFGDFKADKEGMININMGGATKMACPNMDIEQNFFIALDGVNKYQINDSTLTLLKGDEVIATFK